MKVIRELSERENIVIKNIKISEVLKAFKQDIMQVNGDNLKDIILFGSYARGEDIDGSDIDIILVFKIKPSNKIKKIINGLSNTLSLKYDVVISEFVITEYEFKKYKTPFLLNIKKEGIKI